MFLVNIKYRRCVKHRSWNAEVHNWFIITKLLENFDNTSDNFEGCNSYKQTEASKNQMEKGSIPGIWDSSQ